MKYRIVKRNTDVFGDIRPHEWYYAQVKVLGIWFDLRHHPFYSNTRDSYYPGYAIVEEWLENYMKGKPAYKQEVVKTYE